MEEQSSGGVELSRSRVLEEWRNRGVELLGSGGDGLYRSEVMEFWRSEVVEE